MANRGTMTRTGEMSAAERWRRLAEAYRLILSWPDAETAERVTVGDQTHSAATPSMRGKLQGGVYNDVP